MSHTPAPSTPGASAHGSPSAPSIVVHTKVDAALPRLSERRFAGDPERAELIARTRRFKASWDRARRGAVFLPKEPALHLGFVSFGGGILPRASCTSRPRR